MRVAISSILWPPETPLVEITEMSTEMGYVGLEGVREYMGNAPGLRELLGHDGMSLTAGYFVANWFEPNYRTVELARLRRLSEFYASVDAEMMILASAGSPRRIATAGLNPNDRADGMTDYQWGYFCESLNLAADICSDEFSLPVAFKQHAGTYVETASETEKMMAETNPATLKIAADTGHLFYAGMEPIEFFQRNIERISYVTFRDVNTDLFYETMDEKAGLQEFIFKEGFTELGAGSMDLATIIACLKSGNYSGWITVTQDYSLRDATVAAGNSLEHLEMLIAK